MAEQPMIPHRSRFALVFLAWGAKAVADIERFLDKSQWTDGYHLILITDKDTSCDSIARAFETIERIDFRSAGLLRKCELLEHLPGGYDAFCFLDADTIVIGDISLGFEKALLHGIAMSPAPHYSLDHFWGFDKILQAESVAGKGRLQYNTGVIFFSFRHQLVRSVFQRWRVLAERYQEQFENDQPFFTLAMEQENFNPYTLSIGYNYRGFGDPISGEIRIWHSQGNPPPELNQFETAWPPRRAWPDRMERL